MLISVQATGLRAFLAEWWIAPALMPKRQALDLAAAVAARDGSARGLTPVHFAEFLGHVALRTMPGTAARGRVLELFRWLDSATGKGRLSGRARDFRLMVDF